MQTPDEKLALQAVHDAYQHGVNFFDVAPFYGAGSAERVCRWVSCELLARRMSCDWSCTLMH